MNSRSKIKNLNTQNVLAMKDSGYYSLKTAGAKIAIDSVYQLMLKAIKHLPDSSLINFADFGAADGGTSKEMWFNLIKKIRESGDRRQIKILYTDLPSNDFSTLFKNMQGMHGDNNFAYQKFFKDVYVHGCGTGFHSQILPSNTLSLGFSATAMHYISQKPCQIKNHVHMVKSNPSEKIKFINQAKIDWEKILESRANELKPGGRFVCLNFGIDEKGRYLGNTGGHSMFDKFNEHWGKLREDKTITELEYQKATFPQHYRTLEEFKLPFKSKKSSIKKLGLKLISYETRMTRCPYRQKFEKNYKSMTNLEFAKSLIPTMRSWSETVFRSALNERDSESQAYIVDKFYKSYEDEIAKNPEGHAMDYIHIIMEIEKE